MSPELPEDKRLQFIPQDQRAPLTPQLALRVAIVGTFALAIFAILFFRLWFLQVLSGDQYAHAASVNFVRNLEVAAPRGEILDSSGQIMASSRRAYAVKISPPDLPVPLTDNTLAHPPQADALLYDRLAGVVRTADQAREVPGERSRRAPHLADRLRGRAGIRAAPVRPGDGRHRHHQGRSCTTCPSARGRSRA